MTGSFNCICPLTPGERPEAVSFLLAGAAAVCAFRDAISVGGRRQPTNLVNVVNWPVKHENRLDIAAGAAAVRVPGSAAAVGGERHHRIRARQPRPGLSHSQPAAGATSGAAAAPAKRCLLRVGTTATSLPSRSGSWGFPTANLPPAPLQEQLRHLPSGVFFG